MYHRFGVNFALNLPIALIGLPAIAGAGLLVSLSSSALVVGVVGTVLLLLAAPVVAALFMLLPPFTRVEMGRDGLRDRRTMAAPVPWSQIGGIKALPPSRLGLRRTVRLTARGPSRFVRRDSDADATGFDVRFRAMPFLSWHGEPAHEALAKAEAFRTVERHCRMQGVDLSGADGGTLATALADAPNRVKAAWARIGEQVVREDRREPGGRPPGSPAAKFINYALMLPIALLLYAVALGGFFSAEDCTSIRWHTVVGAARHAGGVPDIGPPVSWRLVVVDEPARFVVDAAVPGFAGIVADPQWAGRPVEIVVDRQDYDAARDARRTLDADTSRRLPAARVDELLDRTDVPVWQLRRDGVAFVALADTCARADMDRTKSIGLGLIFLAFANFLALVLWVSRREPVTWGDLIDG